MSDPIALAHAKNAIYQVEFDLIMTKMDLAMDITFAVIIGSGLLLCIQLVCSLLETLQPKREGSGK